MIDTIKANAKKLPDGMQVQADVGGHTLQGTGVAGDLRNGDRTLRVVEPDLLRDSRPARGAKENCRFHL